MEHGILVQVHTVNTLTGSNGCDSVVTLNLTINTGSAVFAGLDTNICSGNDLTLICF